MGPDQTRRRAHSPLRTDSIYRARDIAVDPTVGRLTPPDSGIDGDELGCVYGAPDTPVEGPACLEMGLPVHKSLHSSS